MAHSWTKGPIPENGYYFVKGLLHESLGGDDRAVYVSVEYFVWSFSEQDDPEWIGLDSDITPETVRWEKSPPPTINNQPREF